MKDRTKEIIRDGFGSLVSNAAALRGAKAGPFWLTAVMFFLALLLPIIPIFVSQATTNGSTFLTSYSYGLEKYVTSLAYDLKDTRNAKFMIGEDHLLSIKEGDNDINFSNYGSANPYIAYTNETTGQYDFVVYLSDASTDQEKTNINSEITKTYYVNGTTTTTAETDNVYHPSYMILTKDGIYVAIYSHNAAKSLVSSYFGDYKTMNPNNDCLDTLLTVEGFNKAETTKAIALASTTYMDGVYTNFKKALDKSYETLKIRNTWVTSAIYFGIFFGVSFLMGLLMFLLTRGKNNPNNYFSLWLCLKVQGRLSFCPGLLAMVVGFFLTSYLPMIFIMTIGLRVMWISMKELRPIQQ